MRELLVTPDAAQDMIQAQAWYEAARVGLGRDFRSDLDRMLGQIQFAPFACPIVTRDIWRGCPRRFPYGVFYVIEDDAIPVIACQHHRRSPFIWKSRIR